MDRVERRDRLQRRRRRVKLAILLRLLEIEVNRDALPQLDADLTDHLVLCALRCRQRRRPRPRRWFRRPVWQNRIMGHGAWRTTVQTMIEEDPEMFFDEFRMTPEIFQEILARIEPILQRRAVVGYLTPGERLALTLSYLASGSSMKDAGKRFIVPPPTASQVILETCLVLWEEFAQEVMPELTEERLTQVAEEFWGDWQFPNCVGAIDGKHCILQNFPHGGSEWWNYKHSYSMVLLAICDARYRFLYVDVGGRGRRSDGGLWEVCSMLRAMETGRVTFPPPKCLPGGWVRTPHTLVGDAAFPGTPSMLRPYPGEFLEDPKRIFNYRHSRARRVIENTFGIFSARWRVLRKCFIACENTARAIIKACVVLHNLLVLNEENVPPHQRWYVPPDPRDIDGFYEHQLPPVNYEEIEEVHNHDRIRDHLADYFVGPGNVEWQWEHLRQPEFEEEQEEDEYV